MAHAFDNRNFVSNKQQTFSSIVSPLISSSRPDITNSVLEISSSSPRSSPKLNHPPPSYEESISNKTSTNHHDLTYRQKQQQPLIDGYSTFTSENYNSDTKPPSLARMPRITTTTNNNYFHRTNLPSQSSINGIKTNKTYLNTTQLYISQPSSRDSPPPPPPPRYPLQPPAIPPRNSSTGQQKNSITIPIFNSSISPNTSYRSPVISSTIKRPDYNDQRFNSFSIDNNHHMRDSLNGSTVDEYFGECRKCGEIITSLDDPCDILGQIYHGSCAVCIICGRSVKNKHFFVKDGLYCEEDFLYTGFQQTLEHCVACGHVITDTILQALGQSYHLTCFKCSKCGICLDGMPFITDKSRNLFCVHDYHMTYGPRCDKCLSPICPEDNSNETVRIISMGKTFHIRCYKCEDCSMQLGDEQDRRCYPIDGTLLCQGCCRRRVVSVNKF